MRLRPPVPRPIPPRLSRLSCSLLGCSLLASGAAWAADEAAPASELRGAGLRSPAQSCRASRPNHPPRVTALEPGTARDDPRLWVESNQITGQISQAMRAEGHVQLQRGVLALTADQLDYTAAQNRVHATGRVQLWRDQDYFAGSELDLDTERVEGQFVAPRYWFDRTQAGGRAERLDFLGKNQFAVLGATYSSCDVADGETPAWELTARRVRIDMDANEGVAEGGVLRFQGVPILAWPLLSFPVTDERKSGWLPPQISVASTSGFEFGVPYYWNIAPNLDATVTPVVSLKRGGSMDGEFRYLGEHEQGALRGSWLPRDQLTKTSRWALGSEQRGDLAAQWSYDWHALRVSDNDHWKDGLRGAESLTPRLLNSQAQLRQRSTLDSEWLGEVDQWLYARAQRWQVLQSTLASDAITAPYQRSPQVGALWRGQSVQGPSWSLQTEANRFTRVQDGELTGSRAHLIGELNWPWVMGGWSLTPRLGVNAAAYDTVEAMSDGRHQAGRVIPTVSLDSVWLLDRPTEWFGHSLTQTLEPRLIYARTPWRDLSRTPNFDSARLDFNTSSLTSPNAFSGVDWVSEADQVTLDLTSRVLDANSGAQLASMGVAQRYVLRDLREAPDGQQPARGFSDLYLLGSLSAIERWNLSSSVQYKLDTQQVVRSISSVGYSPGPYRTVTVSHSLQRGASEQVAVGWQWPLRGPAGVPERAAAGTPAEIAPASAVAAALDSRRTAARSSACEGTLYGVGKLDYSTLARRLSSALVGLEYDAGCWIGRVVVERQSTGSATYSNRLMLQLELSGLSRLGSNPLGVLKDSIPGYLLLRDPRADRGAATSNPSGSTGLNTTP